MDMAPARLRHIENAAQAMKEELERGNVRRDVLAELMKFCVLINKSNLRSLTVTPASQWPGTHGGMEIHERQLLISLYRAGTQVDR